MAAAASIDTNLYSRQIGVLGMEAMGKLAQLDVLIVGLRGVGVEAAKNLILAGPRSVVLHDDEVVEARDLGANCFLSEEHIGRSTRAAACLDQLAALNTHVQVRVHEGEIKPDTVARFQAVIFTNTHRDQLVHLNEHCRTLAPPVAFIAADVCGLAGYAFSDFGPQHSVLDPTGEQPRSAVVLSISKGRPGHVVTNEDHHGFQPGDYVAFREVQGMVELNGGHAFRVTECTRDGVALEDTSGFGDYVGGGVMDQVHVPTPLHHRPLRECIVAPSVEGELRCPDSGKLGRAEQLHIAFQALAAFRMRRGHLPVPRDHGQASEVVELAKEFARENAAISVPHALRAEVDEALVHDVALVAGAEFAPLCAFFGGVVAQEVIKVTGKHVPLSQWLYMDALELLDKTLDSGATRPEASRYDDLYALLGRAAVERMQAQQVLVAGAGAVGGELLMHLALMGVGRASAGGRVTVADMDTIELSNLNRQFLFRSKDLGQPKNEVAARAVQGMNPDLAVVALRAAVSPGSEDVFTEEFWETQGVIVSALDSVQARKYVDRQCVLYGKPMLDAGKEGTKCSVQVVLPRQTQCYSDSDDPQPKAFPSCIIKHYPYRMVHCIRWARDVFEDTFTTPVRDALAFLAEPRAFLAQLTGNPAAKLQRLEALSTLLHRAQDMARDGAVSFQACVTTARLLFEDLFANSIKQLLHSFPPGSTNSKGALFWSGTKRQPEPHVFDAADPLHLAVIYCAARLVAFSLGAEPGEGRVDEAQLSRLLAAAPVPAFTPRSGLHIETGDAAKREAAGGSGEEEAYDRLVRQLLEEHTALAPLASQLRVVKFEQDDDTNHHVDFVTAAANLRARNYRIPEVPRHEVKLIAGNVVPSMATTACAVGGLLALELVKLALQLPAELHRNAFANLATNHYLLAEPLPPHRTVSKEFDPMSGGEVRAMPDGFTAWDKVVVRRGDLLLRELVQHLEEELEARVTTITVGLSMMLAPFNPGHAARMDRKVRELAEELTKAPLPKHQSFLMLGVDMEDDDSDVVIPPVQFFFK